MELEIFFNLGAILFRVASTKRGIISDRAMSQWRRTFSLLSVHPSDRVAAKLFDHSQNYKNNTFSTLKWASHSFDVRISTGRSADTRSSRLLNSSSVGRTRSLSNGVTSQERLSPDKNWKKFIHNSVVLWSWSRYRSRVGPDFLGGAGAEKIGRLRF